MGHSLGAGVAAIITFLLRAHYPELSPRITCLSYSPPGGLLNKQAAEESQKWCASVVVSPPSSSTVLMSKVGNDVVPRLSLANVLHLGYEVQRVCQKCRLPKHKLLGYGLLGCCSNIRSNHLEDEVDMIYPENFRRSQLLEELGREDTGEFTFPSNVQAAA